MSELICVWDGITFAPQTPFMARRATEAFGLGEVVVMTVENERSWRSHKAFFATVQEVWGTLPEKFAMEQWAQSPDHLRRYALIRTGFSDSTTYPCETKAEAARLAKALRPIDEFSIVDARETTVVRYVAKSQSKKAMGAEEFQRSQNAVREFLAGLLEEAA